MSNTMREILFRGKRVDNGKWITGFLSKTSTRFKYCIEYIEHGIMVYGEVDPETVGQFTGLTDKNGTRIFEGDIVTLPEETEPYEMRYVIQWEEDNARFIATAEGDTYSFDNIWGCQVEVISNVHDNPELLEGSNK